jgi:hypothetical protein
MPSAARELEEADPLVSLMDAWQRDLLRGKKPQRGSTPYRPANVYASKRRRCTRAMALDLLHPEDDPFDKAIQFERMQQGNEAERAVIARLQKIGPFCRPPFTIAEEQHRFEVADRDGVVLITGKMDGRLKFEDGACPAFEIKSGRTYEACETIEDFDRNPWAWSAVDQLLAYLYADEVKNYPDKEPWGFLLVRRQSDFPQLVRIRLSDHLQRVESFLQQARRAVDARHGRAGLPPFIENPGECRRCPHLNKSCTPAMDYGQGARVIDDPALIEAAEERDRNRAARDRYERADAQLKKELRDVELAIVGNYLVTGKWAPSTKYDVPDEIRNQFARVEEKGKFTLSIEKLGA